MRIRAEKILLLAVLCATACCLLAGPAQAASTAAAVGATAAPAEPSDGSSTAPEKPSGQQSPAVSQEGISLATWFGPGLFGNQTACGQILTKRLAGLANRTLPCGTLVKVTYRGRHLTLPVVDRGPYGPLHANWDITQAAAKQLGMTETSKVDAQIVGHVQNSPNLGEPAGSSPTSAAKPQPTDGATGGASAS
jgi:rare lipoprotein A (peptidoglycan hydrolase)